MSALGKAFRRQKVNFGEFHGQCGYLADFSFSLDSYYTLPENSHGQGKQEKQAASVVSLS